MAIYRRKGTPYWWYDFTVKGARFRGSTEAKTREEAEIIEAKLRSDALLGLLTNKKPDCSLDRACGRYWEEHASELSSAETIDYQILNLVRGLGKDVLLSKLSQNDISIYVAKRRSKVSNSSVNRELTLLRAILRMARDRWGYDVQMPQWKALRLREPSPRERYLTPEEADRLIECAADHLKPIIMFLLYTGCRLSNCLDLDWSQVKMQTREVHFRQKSKSLGGKPHIVPLSEPCFVMLANLSPQDRGPVFTFKGKPIGKPRTSWNTALRKAGISDFRRHDLRHTAASWMVQNGVPLDVVQSILGHTHISTTQRYAHREDSQKRKAVEASASQIRHTARPKRAQVSGKK